MTPDLPRRNLAFQHCPRILIVLEGLQHGLRLPAAKPIGMRSLADPNQESDLQAGLALEDHRAINEHWTFHARNEEVATAPMLIRGRWGGPFAGQMMNRAHTDFPL